MVTPLNGHGAKKKRWNQLGPPPRRKCRESHPRRPRVACALRSAIFVGGMMAWGVQEKKRTACHTPYCFDIHIYRRTRSLTIARKHIRRTQALSLRASQPFHTFGYMRKMPPNRSRTAAMRGQRFSRLTRAVITRTSIRSPNDYFVTWGKNGPL